MIYYAKTVSTFVPLWLLITTSSCTWISSTLQRTYREDLARHRVSLIIAPQKTQDSTALNYCSSLLSTNSSQAVTDQLDTLLAIKKKAHQEAKHIAGFTIQVYTGGSREKAFEVRNRLYELYPHLEPKISYNSTNYTVRTGNFLTQLEAYKVYILLKKHMPQVIMRPIALPNKPHIFSKTTMQDGSLESSVSNDVNKQ